jgi:hypothetical protein
MSDRAGFTYPHPDDMPRSVAEACWDVYWGHNLEAASKLLRNKYGTIEWVYKMAEEVHSVNGIPFNAAAKQKLRSAFTGVPIADLRKRKK